MIFLLFLIPPFSDVNEGKEWIQHENNPKSSVLQIKSQAEHILLAGRARELFAWSQGGASWTNQESFSLGLLQRGSFLSVVVGIPGVGGLRLISTDTPSQQCKLESLKLWSMWIALTFSWCELVGSKQVFHSELWSYPWGEAPVWGWTAWANWSWTEVGKGGLSFDHPGAAFSQEATECLCSLSAGCSAEWPRRSGTSPPAAGPSSRPSPPAHPLASTPSATTARAAPLMLAVATALRWVATPMAWTHRPCSMARGLAVGPAVSVTMTAPVPSWRIRPPSASTCLMRSPSGCAWCAGTLLRGITTAWLPVRRAKPSSRGLFKVQCTNFC